MKTNRAILINAALHTITEIQVGDYRDAQAKLECDLFTMAGITSNGDAIMVDDEGLLKEKNHFVVLEGNRFAGNVLIVGDADEEGEPTNAVSTVEFITEQTGFLGEMECEQFIEPPRMFFW